MKPSPDEGAAESVAARAAPLATRVYTKGPKPDPAAAANRARAAELELMYDLIRELQQPTVREEPRQEIQSENGSE